MQTKFTGTLALLILTAASTQAQAPNQDESRRPQVDSLFAKWNRTDSPGCAVGVTRNGKLSFTANYGMADIASRKPITRNTRFGLHSASKPFVALAIMLVASDGKLSLDDDIRKFIPELPVYETPVTIRHLLLHTSGLPDVSTIVQLQGKTSEDALTTDQAIHILAAAKTLNFAPGDAWAYANTPYLHLLPLVVQRITGKPIGELIENRILAPLGMRSSLFRDDPAEKIEGRASGFDRTENGWRIVHAANDAVVSTLADIALWERNFESPVVGGAQTIETMRTEGRLNAGAGTEYAFGFYVGDYRGQRSEVHSGGGLGGRATLMHLPEIRSGAIVLCNTIEIDADDLVYKLSDIFFAREFALSESAQNSARASAPRQPAPIAVPMDSSVRQFAGLYFAMAGGPQVRRITFSNDTLRLATETGSGTPFIRIGARRFRITGSPTEYQFSEPSARSRMSVTRFTPGNNPTPFESLETFAPPDLTVFAGKYESDALETHVTISVRDGKLFNMWRETESNPMRWVGGDLFTDGFAYFRFERGSGGAVNAVHFHHERVWDITFAREDEHLR